MNIRRNRNRFYSRGHSPHRPISLFELLFDLFKFFALLAVIIVGIYATR